MDAPSQPEKAVLLTVSGPVAWLTLNRPRQANAINRQCAADMVEAVDRIVADVSIKIVALTGAGKIFCGGADLKSIKEDREAGHANPTAEVCEAIGRVKVPVVAIVNGAAVGGGCEIVLCCDLSVMSAAASLSLPEIKFGGLPAAGGTQRMPRLVGRARASEYIMTGRSISAAEAQAIGLVNTVAAPEELQNAADELIAVLASRARYSLVAAKTLVSEIAEGPLAEGLRIEFEIIDSMGTAEERAAQRKHAAAGAEVYAKIFR